MNLVHVIDCDRNPKPASNALTVVRSHSKMGKFVWDPSCIELYKTVEQRSGKHTLVRKYQEELRSRQALNACVLDYLLEHTELIPREWGTVYFLGTEFGFHGEDEDKAGVYVCALRHMGGGKYDRYLLKVEHGVDPQCPVAVLKL